MQLTPKQIEACETFALCEVLHEYPDDKTYQEVLTLLENEDDSVIVSQSFEDWHSDGLIDHINSLRDNVMNLLKGLYHV
jgi:hypothetical protein